MPRISPRWITTAQPCTAGPTCSGAPTTTTGERDLLASFTFAIAMLVARTQVMAGWGLGVLLRFATVAFWAFLGAKALGLPSTPALMSLVVFYFVSTVIEPIFLNAH